MSNFLEEVETLRPSTSASFSARAASWLNLDPERIAADGFLSAHTGTQLVALAKNVTWAVTTTSLVFFFPLLWASETDASIAMQLEAQQQQFGLQSPKP